MFCSGKKKRYTVKMQLMVNNQGSIIHKLGDKKGGRHDYDIYKEDHPVIPKEVVNVYDLGYLGIEKDFPEQLSSLPNKKKKKNAIINRAKRVQSRTYKKEDCNIAYNLSIEKI